MATKMVDGEAVPMTTAEAQAFLASVPAAPAVSRLIAKTAIYRRATDAEIATLAGYLQQQATTRQRLMWQDAEGGLVLVDDVQPLATELFGAARAAVLLV